MEIFEIHNRRKKLSNRSAANEMQLKFDAHYGLVYENTAYYDQRVMGIFLLIEFAPWCTTRIWDLERLRLEQTKVDANFVLSVLVFAPRKVLFKPRLRWYFPFTFLSYYFCIV
jgi:hypothetical protein